MNRGEYGVAIRLNVDYDLSGAASLSMRFTKPSGAKLTKTDGDGVTAPATAASGFAANQYFEYTTEDGDIDEAGVWRVCGIYVDGEKRLVSHPTQFTVGPAC